MFDISLGEIVVIFIVPLLVVGPKKLPEAARALGRGYAEFRRLMSDIRGTIDRDETVSKLRDEFRSAQREVMFGQSKYSDLVTKKGAAFTKTYTDLLSPENKETASPGTQPDAAAGAPAEAPAGAADSAGETAAGTAAEAPVVSADGAPAPSATDASAEPSKPAEKPKLAPGDNT